MKIAHIMLLMQDGNTVGHYMNAKNHEHLAEKVRKRLKKDTWDMGSILIDCSQVEDWAYSFEGDVH